jgi:hypothetical protein
LHAENKTVAAHLLYLRNTPSSPSDYKVFSICKFPNGDVYEGEWWEDLCDGRGVLTTALGDRYEGNFKMGVKDGQGVKRWTNGDVYDGSWRAGLQEGHGALTMGEGPQHGCKYVGQWRGGRRQGEGAFYWPDGSKYLGTWTRDLKGVSGILTLPNGDTYDEVKRCVKSVMTNDNSEASNDLDEIMFETDGEKNNLSKIKETTLKQEICTVGILI